MILSLLAMFQATLPAPHVVLPMLPPAPRLGVAAQLCRQWNDDKRPAGANRTVNREWLLGFIDGTKFTMNGLSTAKILRSSDDPEAMIVFVDTRCATKPDSTVGEAASDLWLSLAQRPEG